MIYTLNKLERDVFLSCTDVISYKKLQEKLPHIPDYQLAEILHSFEENDIVFREEEYYLSLPLSYSTAIGKRAQKKPVPSRIEFHTISNCTFSVVEADFSLFSYRNKKKLLFLEF